MKRITTTLVALLVGGLMLAAAAGAAKPATPGPKDTAKAECLAQKKADKRAFKATYGKGAMRTCVKGEKSNASTTIKNAAKECKAERAADPEAFGTTYGTGKHGKNAFGKCVSTKVKAQQDADVAEFKNAAKECKAERQADPDTFKSTYGSGKNGRNALGKCVSTKVKEDHAKS